MSNVQAGADSNSRRVDDRQIFFDMLSKKTIEYIPA